MESQVKTRIKALHGNWVHVDQSSQGPRTCTPPQVRNILGNM